MVSVGVGWSGTETNVHSNGAECNNLNDVHQWECYVILIKSVPAMSTVVYVNGYSMACWVNFHETLWGFNKVSFKQQTANTVVM